MSSNRKKRLLIVPRPWPRRNRARIAVVAGSNREDAVAEAFGNAHRDGPLVSDQVVGTARGGKEAVRRPVHGVARPQQFLAPGRVVQGRRTSVPSSAPGFG